MADRDFVPLVERARKGDLPAFAELVVAFQDLAVGSAYGWVGDIESARDVTQEAFLEAHLHIVQLREPAAFPGWLRQIVLKHCDRMTRRKRLAVVPLELAADVTAADADPEARSAAAEAGERLRLAVDALPAEERMVVALHYFAELTGTELAGFLDSSVPTIKKRLRNARARLREHGDRLMQETIDRMRPSRTTEFASEVTFFLALREGNHGEVKRLLARMPELVHARQDWDPKLVLEGVLPFATKATALITAIERDDLAMQTLLLDAGADVDGRCGCATGEAPLWAATLLNRRAHARQLLERGADPNVVSASGNRPLHLAAMRGSTDTAVMLLEHGADPAAKDTASGLWRPWVPPDGQARAGRTPAEWARANGHVELARMIEGTPARHRGAGGSEPSRSSAQDRQGPVVHTGIKALDLFAPIPRGGLIRLPFKAGVGMIVLLGELCQRFCSSASGAAIWTGFTQRPFDLSDWEAEMAEFGLADHVHCGLAAFSESPGSRRDAFQHGLDLAASLRDAGRDVLAVVLTAEGFESDVDASLARLSASSGHGTITTVVVTTFPEKRGDVWSRLEPPYTAQITLDRMRGRKHLFPAIHPALSMSDALQPPLVGERHVALARRARQLFDWYAEFDPELALTGAATEEKDRAGAERTRELIRYLCQPFCTTEPFTGRPGEQVAHGELLDRVESILNS